MIELSLPVNRMKSVDWLTGVRDLKSIPATPQRPGLVCSAGGADGSIRIWAASRPVATDASSGFSLQQLIQFEVTRASCTAVAIREVGGTASGAGGTVFSAAGYVPTEDKPAFYICCGFPVQCVLSLEVLLLRG